MPEPPDADAQAADAAWATAAASGVATTMTHRLGQMTDAGAWRREARALSPSSSAAAASVALALQRVAHLEPRLHAWVNWDPAPARARAAALDAGPGPAAAPLWGVPVGLKDVIDTADWPTEHGCGLYKGRRPARDAELVRRLHDAGAVVLGKTVTTELATYAPGPTRNPIDPSRTPGGSSSGSAAAVAAGMVPLAVGTQTNGSVVRPASFCGVVGFKPGAGRIPRDGVLACSPSLDQVGVFAATLADAAALAEVLAGVGNVWSEAARRPAQGWRLRWSPPPGLSRMAPDAALAFDTWVQRLAPAQCVQRPWPDPAQPVHHWHQRLMEAELATAFGPLMEGAPGVLSAQLQAQIRRGRDVDAAAQALLRARQAELAAAMDAELDRCDADAWLCPAALGGAPSGLGSTGDPWMCTPWTFAGLPVVCLPLLHDSDGMPLGLQLIGRRHGDAALLCVAASVAAELSAGTVARPAQ